MAAPPPVFRGSATVTGIGLAATPITYDVVVASTNVTALTQSAKMTQVWEDEIIKDNQGYDAVWIMRNEHGTIDLDITFVGTTAAIAAVPFTAAGGGTISALGTAPFLAPGSVIVLSNFIPTALNGTFRVLSGGDVALTNTASWKVTLKLLKYAAAAQNTAMAVVPG